MTDTTILIIIGAVAAVFGLTWLVVRVIDRWRLKSQRRRLKMTDGPTPEPTPSPSPSPTPTPPPKPQR